MLTTVEERKLLRELAECQRKLKAALDRMPTSSRWPTGGDGPMDLAHYVAATCAGARPEVGARLGAVARRYTELRASWPWPTCAWSPTSPSGSATAA